MGWQDGIVVDAPAQPAWMQGTPVEAAPKRSLGSKALELGKAALEVPLTLGTGVVGSVVGGGAGILQGLFGGQYGTPEGARDAQATAGKVANMLTYKPSTGYAQDALGTIGSFLNESKLAGLGPSEAIALGAMPVSQAATQVKNAPRQAAATVGDMFRKEQPAMSGMGAADAAGDAMRTTRAEMLPVPVRLSKGQASRNFEQQRFERETAKQGSPAGAILREHGAEQNANLIKNLEWFMDESGAVAPSARVAGSTVDDALRSRSDFMKGKYKDAYARAREAGELAEKIDPTPLLQFVSQNASAAELAPILSAIEKEVIRLGGGTKASNAPNAVVAGPMAINDIENLRKTIVRLGRKDETNGHYARLANEVIDQMTEGKGGKFYAEARQLFKEHAGEFKNQGAIKKLLATKPGTTDRAVAYEDVFRHSILTGSMDDTAAIFRSLEQAGPKGKQAIAELKGETIKYLQDQASRNAVKDVNGQPILSYPKLNAAVKELEIDGKLEFLFGKKGAQQIRDITDTIGDLNVAPAGVINTSNTSAVLLDALGDLLTGRVTGATAKAFGGIKEVVGKHRTLRLAREAVGAPEPVPPGVTRH